MKFKLELQEQEINIVLAALSELPYKASFNVINIIKSQAEEQISAQKLDNVVDDNVVDDND